IKEQYNEQQSLLAKQTAIGLEENLAIVVRELELLTNMCAVKTFELVDIQEVMAETYYHVQKHHIYDIGYIDSAGIFRAALHTPQLLQRDFSGQSYFKKSAGLAEPAPVFEFINLPGDSGVEKSIVVAMPIFSEENSFGGAILFVIKLHDLIEGLSPDSKGNNRTWVVDEAGNILYHPQYLTGTSIHDVPRVDESLKSFITMVQKKRQLQGEFFSATGEEILAASYPTQIADQNWSVIISTPVHNISSLFMKFNSVHVFITISAITAIIGGSLFIIFMINRWNKVLQKENKERLHAEQELQRAHDELELRIEERTADLHHVNEYLEKEIEDRKVAEAETVRQNELVKSTIESLSHPFYVIDADNYVIQLANSAANFGELTEKSTCYSLTHQQDHPCDCKDHPCTIKEIKEKLEPVTLEHIHFQDGEKRNFEVHGYPIFDKEGRVKQIIEYSIDITERKQLEEQLHQSQKMESIGRLAGGVAHDFNNILTAIIGFSELAQTKLPREHPVMRDLKIVREAGEKASVLVRKLLALSRKQILEMKIINLNALIEDILKLLGRIIGEDVYINVNTDNEVDNIKADPGQLEQILMNLVVNARDAMPEGGRISIETSNIEIDEKYTKTHEGIKPGSYVMLAITDSGTGMTREVQEKIFEPFFTTKGSSGTGLGLATVYGIVKQHQGHIFVYSEPGMGTTFKIYFPATEESEKKTRTVSLKTAPRGNETLIVVDDDRSILDLIIDTMQPLGYTIIDATCAEEVLEFIERSGSGFDLLLTDMIMPGMNGRELAEKIKERHPATKVVFMSGYTSDMVAKEGILQDGEVFIQKPLSPIYLADRIRRVLDS
ncbi:MAG: response regulator, partial [Deltaproteobacteria bacterium]|nr:response regulator [Deltaproteobacteria bacterium]